MVNITQFPFRKESTSKRMIYSRSFISLRPLPLLRCCSIVAEMDSVSCCVCTSARYALSETSTEPAVKIFSHARVFKSRTASLPKSHPKANLATSRQSGFVDTANEARSVMSSLFQSAKAIFGAQFSRLLIGSQLAARKRVWMGRLENLPGDDHDGMLLACLPRLVSSKALRAEFLCKTTST